MFDKVICKMTLTKYCEDKDCLHGRVHFRRNSCLGKCRIFETATCVAIPDKLK